MKTYNQGINLFKVPVVGFLLKNRHMLLAYRLLALALFLSAIIYGFLHPGKENIFTPAVFWDIFWPFFIVVTLALLGNMFCMICPLGFMGKHLTRLGLKGRPPAYLRNRYIGLAILVISYWSVLYTFPGTLRNPLVVSVFFLAFTILAILVNLLFDGMAFCKYLCPIGSVTTAFSRVGATWLSTDGKRCEKCRDPLCARACPYKLFPRRFDEENSMANCTLCMECARACDAVRFTLRGWSSSLLRPVRKVNRWEIWVYMVMLGVITFAMRFHHGLSRTSLAPYMPWVRIGNLLQEALSLPESVDPAGLTAMVMALGLVILLAIGGFYIASRTIGRGFDEVFGQLGYALAPLMIVGALSHVVSFFLTDYYPNIVKGFSQALSLHIEVEPLVNRGESWLRVFYAFPLLAGLWSGYIMWLRLGFLRPERGHKGTAFLSSSMIVVVYIGLTIFTLYATTFYPGTHHHGG